MATEIRDIDDRLESPNDLLVIALAFLRLGSTSFGGPIAHLGYLRREFVEGRKWIDEADYGDLVALCQFLPGPSSSQLVFSLGMHRAGLLGALVASASFLLPSTLLMLAFAYGVADFADSRSIGAIHGLKLAAVAVVAQAVWGMGKTLCPDRTRVSLCLMAAAILLVTSAAWTQLGVIALGAVVGVVVYRRDQTPSSIAPRTPRANAHRPALATLGFFVLLLGILPLAASSTNSRSLVLFDSFYRSGSLVFGGGHVVLPLLRSELVPRGFLDDQSFLAGYGAAQTLPGPLFAFAAYLGALSFGSDPSWQGGLLCLFAVMLPAWLLIGGALPFWHHVRTKPWARASLLGANAAVVGMLLAALYRPVITESVRNGPDVAATLVAFGLLEHWKLPPWLVVLALAALGHIVLG